MVLKQINKARIGIVINKNVVFLSFFPNFIIHTLLSHSFAVSSRLHVLSHNPVPDG